MSIDPEQYLRNVMATLGQFNEDLAEYATKESLFSSDVANEMKIAKRVIESTLAKLRKDFDKISGSSDPIVHLLAMGKDVQLLFESFHQQFFRSNTMNIEPTLAQQTTILRDHQYPTYLSSLPPIGTISSLTVINVIFKLPPAMDCVDDDNVEDFLPKSIPAMTSINDTVYEWLSRWGLDPSYTLYNTGFKVVGLSEYIYGQSPWLSFQSAREAIAQGKTLTVEVVRMSSQLEKHFYDRITTFCQSLRKDYYLRAGVEYSPQELIVEDMESPDIWNDNIAQLQQQRAAQIQESKNMSLLTLQPDDLDALPHGNSFTRRESVGGSPPMSILGGGVSRGRGRQQHEDNPHDNHYVRGRSQSRAPNPNIGAFFTQRLPPTKEVCKSDEASKGGEGDYSSSSGSGFLFSGSALIAPVVSEDGDDDDGTFVNTTIRPLNACKTIDFGLTPLEDDDYIAFASRGPSCVAENDEDHFQKRPSGILQIPAALMMGGDRRTARMSSGSSDGDDFAPPTAVAGGLFTSMNIGRDSSSEATIPPTDSFLTFSTSTPTNNIPAASSQSFPTPQILSMTTPKNAPSKLSTPKKESQAISPTHNNDDKNTSTIAKSVSIAVSAIHNDDAQTVRVKTLDLKEELSLDRIAATRRKSRTYQTISDPSKLALRDSDEEDLKSPAARSATANKAQNITVSTSASTSMAEAPSIVTPRVKLHPAPSIDQPRSRRGSNVALHDNGGPDQSNTDDATNNTHTDSTTDGGDYFKSSPSHSRLGSLNNAIEPITPRNNCVSSTGLMSTPTSRNTPTMQHGTPTQNAMFNRRGSIAVMNPAAKNQLFKFSTLTPTAAEEIQTISLDLSSTVSLYQQHTQASIYDSLFGKLYAPLLPEPVTAGFTREDEMLSHTSTLSENVDPIKQHEFLNTPLLINLTTTTEHRAAFGIIQPALSSNSSSGFSVVPSSSSQNMPDINLRVSNIAPNLPTTSGPTCFPAINLLLPPPQLTPLNAVQSMSHSTITSTSTSITANNQKLLQIHQQHQQHLPTQQQFLQQLNYATSVQALDHTEVFDIAHRVYPLSLPPFKLRVIGLDGVNLASCPRLNTLSATGNEKPKLSIVSFIVSANDISRGSLSQTSYVDYSPHPRFHQTILPLSDPTIRDIDYSELPKNAKIAFVLVESLPKKSSVDPNASSDSNKESKDSKDVTRHIPLAWCTQQLFLPNDQVLQGKHNLELWPLPTNDDSSCEFLGASRYLTDPYISNNGKVPISKEEKKAKKKDKDAPILQVASGFNTIIDDFDVKVLNYIFRGSSATNFITSNVTPLTLSVEFNTFTCPVINSVDSVLGVPPATLLSGLNVYKPLHDIVRYKELTKPQLALFDQLCASDALHEITQEEKNIMWMCRDTFSENYPHLLPLFLQSVHWNNPHHRCEALKLLEAWPEPKSMVQVLGLLDQPFTDYRVRLYAVRHLERLSSADVSELRMYLLQLTQCLKFEPFHVSPLARFLLSKAVYNPFQFGHDFFWCLKNESVADPPFAERYRVILETYLTFSPLATDQLRTQQHIIDECSRLAQNVRQFRDAGKPAHEIADYYQQGLKHLNRDYFSRLPSGTFQIPLDPRWESRGLIPEKCKIMSSKMAPLWLVFQNSDLNAKAHYAIFKAGDDLRQDILTLQILRFFDKIWTDKDLDMRLSIYNVIATGQTDKGKGIGLVEVVGNASTISGIQTEKKGASGAFDETSIFTFLKSKNPSDEQMNIAVENFTRSCAGYCVATYILGIGDRHNSNVMLQNDGHFFHIDFGHFLGNFKSKFGIQRERSLVLFTREMNYCIGSGRKSSAVKNMTSQFESWCLRALDIARENAYALETLFMLMISAGMPELTTKQAIGYIRDRLCLNKTLQVCRDTFLNELNDSASGTSRRIDNFFHNMKHK